MGHIARSMNRFFFKWRGLMILILVLAWLCRLGTTVHAAPVVIIKADDFFRSPNQAWTNFLEVSRKAGIKVSIGVSRGFHRGRTMADSTWMKTQVTHRDVEFWDHAAGITSNWAW